MTDCGPKKSLDLRSNETSAAWSSEVGWMHVTLAQLLKAAAILNVIRWRQGTSV